MENSKFEEFPEGVLGHLAVAIGDHWSASQMAEIIRSAGFPERSQVAGTKWRHINQLFKEFNSRPHSRYGIAKIVQAFCDPTRWIGKKTEYMRFLNNLNEGLAYVNLQLNESGRIIVTEKRITHAVEEAELEGQSRPISMTISPIFRARDIKSEGKLCFVLMPFKPPFDRLYKEKIKPAIEASGFKCLRADDLFSPTSILEDIWVHICKSQVVIADVTGRNPNVFYEIGIAHTVGKPVIIITQDEADIPFDIAQFRYFAYSDDANGWDTLCNKIMSALKSTTGAL